MIFFSALFTVVLLILAYSLKEDKGTNTAHARRVEAKFNSANTKGAQV